MTHLQNIQDIQNIHTISDWEEGKGHQKGLKIKTLRDEDGSKTILLKLPAGYHMELHTHDHYEQHLVLEGEFQSGEEVFPTGSYRVIPPLKEHGPYFSKDGALILVIWDHM